MWSLPTLASVLQAYKICVWVSPSYERVAGYVDCFAIVAFAQLCIGKIPLAYIEGH